MPYGDLDVAAALGTRLAELYQRAADLSAETMTAQGIEPAAPSWTRSAAGCPARRCARVDPGTPVLLAETRSRARSAPC